ncbi:BBSome-interacting protein 1-like [Lethenteron reissneri]|uniref:BBSome-interacting protein 1-like n=2 Tax=Lethenteron reissneri TaxID=7753 RepID=UPI002AB77297|nr:BBSome-interacting protein 1-like [Lethenteron reissneri]
MFKEVLPKQGQLSVEGSPSLAMCKPKLLPLKSLTLERMEQLQRDAQQEVRSAQQQEQQQEQQKQQQEQKQQEEQQKQEEEQQEEQSEQ